MDFTRAQSLTDIVHGTIDYTGIESAILGTPIFNRLHRILQNSLVFLTYASNKTKRFEHSIGVMNLAGKMFFNSVCNTDDKILKDFFDEIVSSVVDWRKKVSSEHLSSVVSADIQIKYSKENILEMPLPECSVYNKYLPKNVADFNSQEYVLAYFIAFQAIRIAGLLHDVGHLPYSHILEYSIKELYDKVSSIKPDQRNPNQEHFLEVLKCYCDDDIKERDELHEEIGKISVRKIFESISAHLNSEDETNLFFIVSFDYAERILQSSISENNIYSDMHNIVAGIVDADRLDYCSRDLLSSGVCKDIINYERLISTYSIHRCKSDGPLSNENINDENISEIVADNRDRYYFCPHVKNISVVETLLKKRWEIFSLINYHHRVHKHEILLEEVIVDLGYEELESLELIKPLEQGGLPLKLFSIWEIVSLLKGNEPPEYLLVQFDDSWLDTLLKRKFFKKYQKNFVFSTKNANDVKWNRLDELISSQRHYCSALKRFEDFKQIDCSLFNAIKEMLNQTALDSYENSHIGEIVKIPNYNEFFVQKSCLFFTWLIHKLKMLPVDKKAFYECIQEKLKNDKTCKKYVNDVIIKDCTFKTGCAAGKNRLMMADNDSAKPFQYFSAIEQYFIDQRNCSLPIHMYYLPSYPQKKSNKQIEDMLFDKFVRISFELIKKIIKEQNNV